MTEKITFRATHKHGFDTQMQPTPASKFIPDWWKSMNIYEDIAPGVPANKLIINNRNPNYSFKKCTPMLDAITSGYIIPLWADVQLNQLDSDLGYEINWKVRESNVFDVHGGDTEKLENPDGYHNKAVKYLSTWIPHTPPGYSCLITSPFGYKNLPFKSIPAVVDTDKSTLEVVFPMWVSSTFNGIVEKGTPLVQVTPFKRVAWEAEFDYYKEGEFASVREKNFNGTIIGHYLKNVWSKKVYK
jgi:hypothetical protein